MFLIELVILVLPGLNVILISLEPFQISIREERCLAERATIVCWNILSVNSRATVRATNESRLTILRIMIDEIIMRFLLLARDTVLYHSHLLSRMFHDKIAGSFFCVDTSFCHLAVRIDCR